MEELAPDGRPMVHVESRDALRAWLRENHTRGKGIWVVQEPGLAAVERAKANGAWTALDEVEAGVVPDDLDAAFQRHPGSREQWDTFARSSRRAILEWVGQAKRMDTRENRVEETASLAARGEKANQWPRKQ